MMSHLFRTYLVLHDAKIPLFFSTEHSLLYRGSLNSVAVT